MTGTTEERVIAYGQRAVGQGTRVAQVPAKKGGTAAPPVPAHVERARNLWAAHFAHLPGRKNVVIHDIGRAPSPKIATSSFDAWTNSPTEIYVHVDAAASHATLLAVLHHEDVHVGQFLAHGSRPPADHAAMMTFECAAYGASAIWSKGHSDPAVRAFEPRFEAMRATFCDEIARVQADPKIQPAQRNAVYRSFLISQQLLPQHTLIKELYAP